MTPMTRIPAGLSKGRAFQTARTVKQEGREKDRAERRLGLRLSVTRQARRSALGGARRAGLTAREDSRRECGVSLRSFFFPVV